MKSRMKLYLLSILLLSSNIVFSQIKDNLLKVKGEAILKETPELMLISIPIVVKDSVYSVCSDKLIKRFNDIKKVLSHKGIKGADVKTDNLYVNENYVWDGSKRKKDGYVGNINVKIELTYSSKLLNGFIRAIKDNLSGTNYNVSFELSKNQKSQLLEKVIDMAVKNATRKASILANSLKVRLSDIKEVNFGYVLGNDNMLTSSSMYGRELDDSTAKDNLILSPQAISIKKSVAVVWKIEQ